MKTCLTASGLAVALAVASPSIAQEQQDAPANEGQEAESRDVQGDAAGQQMSAEETIHHARRARSAGNMMMLMFVLADTDGNGALSLEEVLAVHERMFKTADADGDGQLTMEEMRGFMQTMSDSPG